MSTPCYLFFRYDSTLDSINFWLNRADDPPETWPRPAGTRPPLRWGDRDAASFCRAAGRREASPSP